MNKVFYLLSAIIILITMHFTATQSFAQVIQTETPQTVTQPAAGGPKGHNRNDVMQFLLHQGTAADAVDINKMGYTYN